MHTYRHAYYPQVARMKLHFRLKRLNTLNRAKKCLRPGAPPSPLHESTLTSNLSSAISRPRADAIGRGYPSFVKVGVTSSSTSRVPATVTVSVPRVAHRSSPSVPQSK